MNDTRVTALRLHGERESGGKVEFLLLRELRSNEFEVMAKPAKKLRPGTRILFEHEIVATACNRITESTLCVRFNSTEELDRIGRVPLPPYITAQLDDEERYQTVYSTQGGSAAAPTAGLHFTTSLLKELQGVGVEIAFVTLDVGIDTFRPVQSEVLDEHSMHGELCTIPVKTAEAIEEAQGRIIAVGTTAVRTLESLAVGPRQVKSGSIATKLFIRPGFEFRIVDGMFTNFHLPRTTMLMMISALSKREFIFAAYEEALSAGYRFLSFGDSMLIL